MSKLDIKREILADMRAQHESILSFSDALDAKLNTLLSSSLVILGVFSFSGMSTDPGPWYWIALAVVALVFFYGVMKVLPQYLPQIYTFPLKAEWSSVNEDDFNFDDDDESIDILINQHIVAIKKNNAVLETKSKAVRVGWITFYLATAVMIVIQLIALIVSVYVLDPSIQKPC